MNGGFQRKAGRKGSGGFSPSNRITHPSALKEAVPVQTVFQSRPTQNEVARCNPRPACGLHSLMLVYALRSPGSWAATDMSAFLRTTCGDHPQAASSSSLAGLLLLTSSCSWAPEGPSPLHSMAALGKVDWSLFAGPVAEREGQLKGNWPSRCHLAGIRRAVFSCTGDWCCFTHISGDYLSYHFICAHTLWAWRVVLHSGISV